MGFDHETSAWITIHKPQSVKSSAVHGRLGAVWVCDEWELPKTRDLFYEALGSGIGEAVRYKYQHIPASGFLLGLDSKSWILEAPGCQGTLEDPPQHPSTSSQPTWKRLPPLHPKTLKPPETTG